MRHRLWLWWGRLTGRWDGCPTAFGLETTWRYCLLPKGHTEPHHDPALARKLIKP